MSRRGRLSHGAARGSAWPLRPAFLFRIAVAIVLAVAAIWLIVAVSAAALLRDSAPEIALKLAPFDARAMGEVAERDSALNADRRGLEQAAATARRALQRDPTVVRAWRTLALLKAGEQRPADSKRLMEFAGKLSPRDTPTQLWLIEDAVQRNDVLGALRHYDLALRSTFDASDVLLPILVSATAQPSLIEPIAGLLRSDPPWGATFYAALGQNAPSGRNAADLLQRLRSTGYTKPFPNLATLPSLLVQRGDYQSAFRVFAILQAADDRSGDEQTSLARNPKVLPFDWDLASDADLHATPELRQGVVTPSLYVYASGGSRKVAARKLMLLSPGRFTLESVVRVDNQPVPPGLNWNVRCDRAELPLLSLLVSGQQAGRLAAHGDFVVPAHGCGAQWLELEVKAPDGPEPSEFWVERIQIKSGAPATAPTRDKF